MSESEHETAAISDEQLPPDLVPGHDNPLAEPLPAGEDAGDLLHDGKRAREDDDDPDGVAGDVDAGPQDLAE